MPEDHLKLEKVRVAIQRSGINIAPSPDSELSSGAFLESGGDLAGEEVVHADWRVHPQPSMEFRSVDREELLTHPSAQDYAQSKDAMTSALKVITEAAGFTANGISDIHIGLEVH